MAPYIRVPILVPLLTVVIAVGGVLLAASPATGPSSAAGANLFSVPEDLSSPRGAIKVFRSAMLRSDGTAIVSVVDARTPVEKEFLKAYADEAAAKVVLKDAVRLKFPTTAPSRDSVANDEIARTNPAIDAMHEEINGDDAVVTDGTPNSQKMTLHLVGRQWKIPFEVIFPPQTIDLEESLRSMAIRTPIYNSLAAEMAGGKFKTMQEFQQAGQQRMASALVAASATQPTVVQKLPTTRGR